MSDIRVDSYLELYMTLFGWAAYRSSLEVLYLTGLLLVPVLWFLIRNWTEGMQTPGVAGVQRASRLMVFDTVAVGIVLLVALYPAVPISPELLRYEPPPTLATHGQFPVPVTAADSGTTYGETGFRLDGLGNESVRVPVLWAGTMAVSSGINHAIRRALPTANQVRLLDMHLSDLRLDGEGADALLAEVRAFHAQCYAPALNHLRRRQVEGDLTGQMRALIDEHGYTDLDWIGSRILVLSSGLYRRCDAPVFCGAGFRATQPINGWPIDPSRDTESYYQGDSPAAQFGQPYCDEWWQESPQGLRQRILNHKPSITSISEAMAALMSTPQDNVFQDRVVRRILEQSRTSPEIVSSDMAYYSSSATGDGWGSRIWREVAYGARRAAATVASFGGEIVFSGVLYVAQIVAPMIQAVILGVLYMLLPFLILLGGLKLVPVLQLMMAIFTVKFWSSLWAFAWWVDQNLMLAMYPTGPDLWHHIAGGEKRMLLDLITSSLFIGLPVMWTYLMVLVGQQYGNQIASTMNSMREGGPMRQVESGAGRAMPNPGRTGQFAMKVVGKGLK